MEMKMDKQIPNLLVLVNSAPQPTIRENYPEHEIFDDSSIFRAINGMPVTLGGSVISASGFSDLAKKIEENIKLGKKILIHSFNPVVINSLESRKTTGGFKPASVVTDLESCKSRFIVFDNGRFSSLLDSKSVKDEINLMGIGEALSRPLFMAHSRELNKVN